MVAGPADPRVSALQRVAKSHDTVPRVRELPGGFVEVVSAKRGRFDRHRVDASGQAALIETIEPQVGWRVGSAVMVTGAVAFLLPFLAEPLGLLLNRWVGLGWLLGGMVVIWVGCIVRQRAVQRSLDAYREEDGWAEVNLLLKLSPEKPPLAWLSVAQLAGVDRLSVERGRASVVRDCGHDGVEVVTEDHQVLERHVIDQAGVVRLVDSCREPRRSRFRSLKARARSRYGGRRGDWFEIDLRPTD